MQDLKTRFSASSIPAFLRASVNASYITKGYGDGPIISRSNMRDKSKWQEHPKLLRQAEPCRQPAELLQLPRSRLPLKRMILALESKAPSIRLPHGNLHV